MNSAFSFSETDSHRKSKEHSFPSYLSIVDGERRGGFIPFLKWNKQLRRWFKDGSPSSFLYHRTLNYVTFFSHYRLNSREITMNSIHLLDVTNIIRNTKLKSRLSIITEWVRIHQSSQFTQLRIVSRREEIRKHYKLHFYILGTEKSYIYICVCVCVCVWTSNDCVDFNDRKSLFFWYLMNWCRQIFPHPFLMPNASL